jgi:chromosome segregation ATPase
MTMKEDIAEIKKDLKENTKDVNELKISINQLSDMIKNTSNKVCEHEKRLLEDCPVTVKRITDTIELLKQEDIKFGLKQQIIWAILVFLAITASNFLGKYFLGQL